MLLRTYRAVSAVVNLLLPPACLLCGQLLCCQHQGPALCSSCRSRILPLTPNHCLRCSQPFADSASSHYCGHCLTRQTGFTKAHVLGLYQGAIKESVHQLKYRNRLSLAKPLGDLLSQALQATDSWFCPELIVPVPLHARRLRRRGYNQALELARPIASSTGLRIDSSLLQRVRDTPQQQGLSASQRKKNLRKAFVLASQPTVRRILLVDDVMTTGETAYACCRTLLSGGVAEIQVAVVGRA